MKAGDGDHFWPGEITKLGHEVRSVPTVNIHPYVKRNRTGAQPIREAATRRMMRFVPVKSADRQRALLSHKVQSFLVPQRTQIVNAIHAHQGKFRVVVATGI